MSAAGLIPWAIEALIASTVLMVAVLCLRGLVRRSFGPDIAYALWALPALRLLLPPLPQSWREIAVAPVVRASEQITVYVIEPLAGDAAAPAVQHPSLGPILVSIAFLLTCIVCSLVVVCAHVPLPAQSSCRVGRNRISLTSTSSGWLIAKTTIRANESAGIAIS